MKLRNIIFSAMLVFLFVILAVLAVYFMSPKEEVVVNHAPVFIAIPPTSEDAVVQESVTQMAEAQIPIPTMEIVYLYDRDLTGLQAYLEKNATNWLSLSLNVHTLEIFGVGSDSQKVENSFCGGSTYDDLLCRYAIIEYTSIYKGVITGGVNSDFILKPQLALKEDWSEISRTTVDNKTSIVMGSTAVITYTGYSCVTNVEETSPSPIPEGQTPPTDRSYTIKSLDERRLWPDLGPYLFPTGINEDDLRLDAERKAKATALTPDKVALILDYVEADLGLGSKFQTDLATFYNPYTAQIFGVKGFEIVVQLTRGSLNTRCDESPILK